MIAMLPECGSLAPAHSGLVERTPHEQAGFMTVFHEWGIWMWRSTYSAQKYRAPQRSVDVRIGIRKIV